MAITILKRPHLISPVGNENVWSVTSSLLTLVYIVVTVKDAVSNGVITKKKVYQRPNTLSIDFDLADVLSDALKEVNVMNFNVLCETSLIQSYK